MRDGLQALKRYPRRENARSRVPERFKLDGFNPVESETRSCESKKIALDSNPLGIPSEEIDADPKSAEFDLSCFCRVTLLDTSDHAYRSQSQAISRASQGLVAQMKFTIALADLESLVKGAAISRPKKTDVFTLSACAARVFVESKGGVAGIEALVLSDGAVTLPAQKFGALLKTYKGTRFLNFDGNADGLQIQTFRMPVLSYNPHPKAPADFHVFPVTVPPSSQKSQRT